MIAITARLLVAGLVLAHLAQADLRAALDHEAAHHDNYVSELKAIVAIPSISAQSSNLPDLLRAAEWVKTRLTAAGLQVSPQTMEDWMCIEVRGTLKAVNGFAWSFSLGLPAVGGLGHTTPWQCMTAFAAFASQNTAILPTNGPRPVVFGEYITDPKAKTVLIYGHCECGLPGCTSAWVIFLNPKYPLGLWIHWHR